MKHKAITPKKSNSKKRNRKVSKFSKENVTTDIYKNMAISSVLYREESDMRDENYFAFPRRA